MLTEKKPVVWRNQQQGSLRESKYEGLNNTSVLSSIQENSSETNLNSSNSAPSYDAPLSSLALNVASQINKTPGYNNCIGFKLSYFHKTVLKRCSTDRFL